MKAVLVSLLVLLLDNAPLQAQVSSSGSTYGGWQCVELEGGFMRMSVVGSHVFIGLSGKFFASSDLGATWYSTAVGNMTGTDSLMVSRSTDGFLYSTDTGITWSETAFPDSSPWPLVTVGRSTLFVANEAGVYRSMDYGTTWTCVLSGYAITGLACAANALIATTNRQILRSLDAGGTWEVVLTSSNLHLGDPLFGSHHQVKTWGHRVLVSNHRTSFLSLDVGSTWADIGNGSTYHIAETAVTDSCLFRMLEGWDPDWGFFFVANQRSTDNGFSWQVLSTPEAWFDVCLDPQSLGSALIAVGRRVFISRDEGATWEQCIAAPSPRSVHVTCLAKDQSALHAGSSGDGLFLSTNGGSEWTHRTELGEDVIRDIVPSSAGLLVLAPDLWLVDDEAVNITSNLSYSYYGLKISGMIAVGSDFFVAHYQGVFRSTDEGVTWFPASNGLYLPTDRGALLYCLAQSDSFLFAGFLGIFRTSDRGASWQAAGLQDELVTSMTSCEGGLLAATYGGEIYRSWNEGLSWERVQDSVGWHIQSLSSMGEVVLACTGGGDGGDILCSSDGGRTWNSVATGLSDPRVADVLLTEQDAFVAPMYEYGIWCRPLFEIAFPALAPVLLGPTDSAETHEEKTVLSWEAMGGAEGYHVQVSIGRGFEDSILVVDTLLFETSLAVGIDDEGWEREYHWRVRGIRLGILSSWSMVRAFTPRLFPPAPVRGLFPLDRSLVSPDSVTFIWSRGAPAARIYRIEISADSLFQTATSDTIVGDTACTKAHLQPGIWYWWRVGAMNDAGWGEMSQPLTFGTSLTSVNEEGAIPLQNTLSQNYPNPFNPSTTIRYGLSQRSHVTLTVFNTLGEQLVTLVRGEEERGYHEVQFDGSSLASGVYLYRLQADHCVQTRGLVVLK